VPLLVEAPGRGTSATYWWHWEALIETDHATAALHVPCSIPGPAWHCLMSIVPFVWCNWYVVLVVKLNLICWQICQHLLTKQLGYTMWCWWVQVPNNCHVCQWGWHRHCRCIDRVSFGSVNAFKPRDALRYQSILRSAQSVSRLSCRHYQ
jgi:hypothetical protein